MSTTASSHLSQWWVYSSNAANGARLAMVRTVTSFVQFGATWQAAVAALATWVFRALRSLVQHLEDWASDEPRTAKELLALARSLERTQPSLAAELRFIASHRPDDVELNKEPL